MKEPTAHLDAVGSVVEALAALALEPVLVGGMALVVLGSRRVTRDLTFLISRPGERRPSRSEPGRGVSPRKRISCD